MKIIGVTGGVGAGKSEVLDYLSKHENTKILKADEIGHLLMKRGEICYEPVLALFGDTVLGEDLELIRSEIAKIVYTNPDKLQALDQIIHPQVRSFIERSIKDAKQEEIAVFVLEAALLLEEHYDEICDEVWFIFADEEIRIRRLAAGRGYSEEKAKAIIANQLSEETFRSRCDAVIDNSSDFVKTIEQIEDRMGRL